MKGFLSTIFKIVKSALYAFVLLLLLVILVQRVSNNSVSIGGFRAFVIVSESMIGEYDIGDIIITKQVGPEEIDVGDNVTYLGKEGQVKGLIITHKVVEKKEDADQVYFTTRGIVNELSDPVINYNQIYGKVIYKTYILSFIAKLLNNKLTYYLLFASVALIISIQVVSAMFEPDEEESEEDDRGE